LLNLVNNAIQAVETRAELSIHFSLGEQVQARAQVNTQVKTNGEWVQPLIIDVVDKGPGIKQDILNSVTDVFMTTKAQGTGLGLSVVQTVMRAHGGELQLQSKEGVGTHVRLSLPLASQAPERSRVVSGVVSQVSPTEEC
jgi:two-component system sensor histidine kinase FlrB